MKGTTMTGLGKICVLFNLALSLVLMVWAFSVTNLPLWVGASPNRIDWSNKPAKDGKPEGELLSRQDKIKELWAGYQGAEARWNNARTELLNLGKDRSEDLLWFEKEIQLLRTGETNAPAKPSRQIVYAGNLPELEKNKDGKDTNRPKMTDAKDRQGRDLFSLAFYDKEEKDKLAAIDVQAKRLEKLIKEDIEYTIKMVGDEKMMIKGLQQRNIDERMKREEVLAEHALVKPALINAFVDSELILKRQAALKARVAELKGPEAAAGTGGR
jgi:hypothetical protein